MDAAPTCIDDLLTRATEPGALRSPPRARRITQRAGARRPGPARRRQTAGNWVVESALADLRAKVHQGIPTAEPLIEDPVFAPLVSQMVKIGEEMGVIAMYLPMFKLLELVQ